METAGTPIDKENAWYAAYYSYFIFTLMAAIFILGCFVLILLYQVSHRPLPLFFAVAPNGQRLPLVSYDEPNLLPSTLIKWASKAAVAASTLDFVNYNKQLDAARPYFTDAGWLDYQRSVSELINTVRKNQLLVSGVVAGTPIVASQGDLEGRGYVWRIQMPFLVTYQASDTQSKKQFTVMLTIIRIPTSKNPAGIGIDQFVMV